MATFSKHNVETPVSSIVTIETDRALRRQRRYPSEGFHPSNSTYDLGYVMDVTLGAAFGSG